MNFKTLALTSLTLLGSVMAPMAKADLASDYGTQQTQEQSTEQLCKQMHEASQYGVDIGIYASNYYIDENNHAWMTKMSDRGVCTINSHFPMDVVYQDGSSKFQHKIEGDTLVRYEQDSDGSTTRMRIAKYRF